MTQLRFVHAADLHLDSPFTGMRAEAPSNVADALYRATFDAYDNIIALCISESVDALLVAGDIYDNADRSLRAQRAFITGLERLDEAGIRSFVCHGNHDPLDGWEARLTYPPSCHRFGPSFERVPVFDEDPGCAVIYGISYPESKVTRNLVSDIGTVDSGSITIGLVHASVGNNPGHYPYAPCSLEELIQSGFDYWALGHVHTRQVLREREPTVVYPGNPQGKSPNETGPKGVYLVELNDTSDTKLEFRCTDSVRWVRSHLDISKMQNEQDLFDSIEETMQETLSNAEGRSSVTRITLSGRGALSDSLRQPNLTEELREGVNQDWEGLAPFVWCERIEDNTASPFNREDRIAGSDFIAEFLRVCESAKTDQDLQEQIRVSLAELYELRTYRQHLKDSTPKGEELCTLIEESELIAMNLLITDDEA